MTADAAPPSELKHLLSLRDLDHDEWEKLLHHAELLSGPRGREPLLAGKRFGQIFLNPSLRTRTAFEVACWDLGAHAVYLQPGTGLWELDYRKGVSMTGAAAEHVQEAIGVLGRMLDGIGMRSFANMEDAAEDAEDPVLSAVAAASSVPVLNLESAMDHPHQGLADALTLRRHLGDARKPARKVKVVVRWAPHINPLPMAVPHAAVLAFARDGHEVVLAHPSGCGLDGGVLSRAVELAGEAGGSIEVMHDKDEAMDGATVVYAKSWGPRYLYGNKDAACAFLSDHLDWMVTAEDMARTDEGSFMHCLPVRRGLVVEDAVLDSPRSLVLEQGSARLDVQKATLCRALGVEP